MGPRSLDVRLAVARCLPTRTFVSSMSRAIKVAHVRKLLTNSASSHRGVISCASYIMCVCDCARHTVAISGCVLLPYSR